MDQFISVIILMVNLREIEDTVTL